MIGGRSSRRAAVAVGQLQAGRVLERLQRAALDLAGVEQDIELAQRRAAIDGFEIVVGAEQALAAGLALALGDGAERVEPARDGGEEALLGLHVGGDRPEQRRLRLVGAVRAAETLDGGVGLPARFQQIVDAQTLVLRREIGMVAASGAAGIGEDQNALLVVHEGLRLGEIGRAGAGFDRETVETADPVLRTMRRERPVTSATMSVPNRCTIWSSAPWTGASEASRSIMRSRRSTASRHWTGWPSR